jgi:hypothetical protein
MLHTWEGNTAAVGVVGHNETTEGKRRKCEENAKKMRRKCEENAKKMRRTWSYFLSMSISRSLIFFDLKFPKEKERGGLDYWYYYGKNDNTTSIFLASSSIPYLQLQLVM